MIEDYCYGFICFVPLDANAHKFFGFSEFIAGLALMIIVWTIVDVRYKFRVNIAPLPLKGITFIVISSIGILTLLTDLWRAEEWLVPKGNILTHSGWQALLGGSFLLTVLVWTWFAVFRTSGYSKWNAKRFVNTLANAIIKGSHNELSIIADELRHSIKSIVSYATDDDARPYKRQPPPVSLHADEILQLISHERFCRAIIEASPGTAGSVFEEIRKTKKYGVRNIKQFARNIVRAALSYEESFLYHEVGAYGNNLMGLNRPLCQTLFSDHKMVEAISTLIAPYAPWEKVHWNAPKLEAYCSLVLIAFEDYIDRGYIFEPQAFYEAKDHIEMAISDFGMINGATNSGWYDDIRQRHRVVIDFIRNAIKILGEKPIPDNIRLLRQEHSDASSVYDDIAEMIHHVISSASEVISPSDLCRNIQCHDVWRILICGGEYQGAGVKLVMLKVRRLIYDDIRILYYTPSIEKARILRFCLTVMGFRYDYYPHGKVKTVFKRLHKVILIWMKRNYAVIHSNEPVLAEACLPENVSYDVEYATLRKSSSEGQYTCLRLDDPKHTVR